MKRINLRDLLDFAPPVAACIVLLLVFGPLSIIMFPVVAISSIALVLYRRRIESDTLHKRELKDSASAMRSIHNSISKGANILDSIEAARRNTTSSSGIGSVLSYVKQRILLGQDLSMAIRAETKKNTKNHTAADAIEPLRAEYDAAGSVNESAANSAISLEKKYAEIKANEDGRLPRYLIMGMVSSTILPSMATFAFVGYSILYYSAIFLMLYCTVMLGVLPNVYSAIRMKLSGLYNG